MGGWIEFSHPTSGGNWNVENYRFTAIMPKIVVSIWLVTIIAAITCGKNLAKHGYGNIAS